MNIEWIKAGGGFRIAILAAFLLAGLVYLPGLPGDFIFDDIGSITGNQAILLDHLTINGLVHAVLSAPIGGLMRPVSTLSFVLDAHFFGLSPLAFKLTNIVIHIAVGVVLWFLSREILRAAWNSYRDKVDETRIAWLSLIATTLWSVHPLNLTAVLYAVQRDTSLAALFSSAAMFAYLLGRRRQLESRGGQILIWLATPALTFLGMLCKETAALVPCYLLIIEFTLLHFRGANNTTSTAVHWFYIAFLFIPLLAFCSLLAVKPGYFFGAYVDRDFTLYERLLSESRILLDYLRWTALPDLRQLGLFHDDIAPSRGLLQPLTTLPCVLAIAALLVGAVHWRRRFPFLAFGILWFFAGHIMESTVLPLELAFEHRNYLPIFGLILGITVELYRVLAVRVDSRLTKSMVSIAVVVLASATAMRASEWRSELDFARFESSHHPHSPRASAELGWAYMGYIIATKDTSLVPQAVEIEERSKADDPDSINQDVSLAYMFTKLHDLENAKQYFQAASKRATTASATPTFQLTLQSLLTLTAPEQQSLFPDISALFNAALSNPKMMRDSCYYANLWNTMGLYQERIQEIPGALNAVSKAVSLCPGSSLIRWNLADMLLQYGDTKDAKTQLDALRNLHDFRHWLEVEELEEEYDRQLATQTSKPH